MKGGLNKAYVAQIIFNGKFLSAAPTGVHRVARELILAVDEIIALDNRANKGMSFLVAKPLNSQSPIYLSKIAVVLTGRLVGQLWEQISLPRFARRGLLVNLCNLAPIVQPGIVMIHDAQVHIVPQSYSRSFVAFYKAIQPLIGRRAKLVITVSDYSRKMLIKHRIASHDKIRVIHNGVDHMLKVEPNPRILSILGIEHCSYVVALANTQVHKNIKVLFKAFAEPLLAKAKIVLVGTATAEDFLKEGHTHPANAVFAGRVTDEELRAILESAVCLVFPSTTEGFGLPPLEAMILGCPAVVAPCGALPEICGSAVIYADANDPYAWASAISKLMDYPQVRLEQGERGRLHAAEFTWAKSARQLLNILDEQSTPPPAAAWRLSRFWR